MKEKKPIIKFFKKSLKLARTVLLLAVSAVGINQGLVANRVAKLDMKSTQQVYQDFETLGISPEIAQYSTFINKNKLNRLAYNEGEPIKVYVYGGFSDREKEVINEVVFNYYNPIFKVINPKIQFVNSSFSSAFLDQSKGKNSVFIVPADFIGAAGVSIRIPNLVNAEFHSGSVIGISKKAYDLSEDKPSDIDMASSGGFFEENETLRKEAGFYNTVFEEFTHYLGLGDVYYKNDFNLIQFGMNNTTDKQHKNTIMNNYFERNNSVLYPNDFKSLLALYYEGNTKDSSGVYSEQRNNEMKQIAEEYSEVFYSQNKEQLKNYLQRMEETYPKLNQRELIFKDISEDEVINLEINKESLSVNYVSLNKKEKDTYFVYSLNAKFKDDGYAYITVSERDSKKIIENIKAPYVLNDGVIYIEDVKFVKSNLSFGIDMSEMPKGGGVTSLGIMKVNGSYSFVELIRANHYAEYNIDIQKIRNKEFATKADKLYAELNKEVLNNSANARNNIDLYMKKENNNISDNEKFTNKKQLDAGISIKKSYFISMDKKDDIHNLFNANNDEQTKGM